MKLMNKSNKLLHPYGAKIVTVRKFPFSLAQAAKDLGVTRNHLYYVILKKRESHELLGRFEEWLKKNGHSVDGGEA